MLNNLEFLYDDIISATKDINDIISKLQDIKGNVICLGAGGSKVVAAFASLVLEYKNKVDTKTLDFRDLFYLNSDYDNIFISSFSGSNYGVKKVVNLDKKKYLLTTRKSNINDEVLLTYKMENRNSFISLNQTIVPMAILLKYYLEDKYEEVIEEIFSSIDKDAFLDVDNVINIFTGLDTNVASIFLESSFVESGLSVPIIHEKYDYCHGRSTINKSHFNRAIYLSNKDSLLDDTLKDVIKSSMKDYIFLRGPFNDLVINQFYLTLASIYLIINIAKSKKVDLAHIKYDHDIVKKVYYFKGSM